MTQLRAGTTLKDHKRCVRAVLAWSSGDQLAFDNLMNEVMQDPTGVPGLLFDALELAADALNALGPETRDNLLGYLLTTDESAQDNDQSDDDEGKGR